MVVDRNNMIHNQKGEYSGSIGTRLQGSSDLEEETRKTPEPDRFQWDVQRLAHDCDWWTNRAKEFSEDNLLHGRLREGMDCYRIEDGCYITPQQFDDMFPIEMERARYLACKGSKESVEDVAAHADDLDWLKRAYARGVEDDSVDGVYFTSCPWTDEDTRRRRRETETFTVSTAEGPVTVEADMDSDDVASVFHTLPQTDEADTLKQEIMHDNGYGPIESAVGYEDEDGSISFSGYDEDWYLAHATMEKDDEYHPDPDDYYPAPDDWTNFDDWLSLSKEQRQELHRLLATREVDSTESPSDREGVHA